MTASEGGSHTRYPIWEKYDMQMKNEKHFYIIELGMAEHGL